MSGLGAAITLFLCLAVLVSPRQFTLPAFLAGALYITQGQNLDILGINFTAVRFVEIALLFRVLAQQDYKRFHFARSDVWLLTFIFYCFFAVSARTFTIDMYSLGAAADASVCYLAVRCLLSTSEEIKFFLKCSAFLVVPFALAMLNEAKTGHNLFSIMGGVPVTPVFREGYYRCQASFRHSITAGTVGASFLPLFLSGVVEKSWRFYAGIGIISTLAIVIASHSSGPLLSMIAAFAAWVVWPIRKRMRIIRWIIVLGILTLHMAMKAPVWFIFDRISGLIGGDGWHRSNLIDQFVKHFSEWWLLGMPIENTSGWAATVTKFGAVDVTNYYVSIGLVGGLIALILFFSLLKTCFSLVGRALSAVHQLEFEKSKQVEFLLWGAGSAVLVHAVNLTAVSYWDQSYVIWYIHLAVAVSTAVCVLELSPSTGQEEIASEGIIKVSHKKAVNAGVHFMGSPAYPLPAGGLQARRTLISRFWRDSSIRDKGNARNRRTHGQVKL
jgi:hypothetical protein